MFLIEWIILRFNFGLYSYMMIAMNMKFSLLCVCAWSSLVIAGSDDHDKSCYEPVLVDASNGLIGEVSMLKIIGDLAYVIDDSQDSMVILDMSQPGFPVLSRTGGFDRINDIVINDKTAYLTEGSVYRLSNGNVYIWDIEDPTDPWFIRSHTTYDNESKLLIDGQVMHKSPGLVLNVARQRSLKIETTYGSSVSLYPIANIENNIATTYGMEIVDFNDPANPVLLFPSLASAHQIEFVEKFAYARNGSISLFEQNNDSPWSLLAEYETFATDFVVRGSMVYLTTPEGLEVVDWSNPSTPYRVALYNDQLGLNHPTQIELLDDIFYITDHAGVMAAYQINSNPVGTHATSGDALEIALMDDLALIAADDGGMQIFDVARPHEPVLLSTFPTGNDAVGIEAKDGIAYIATHQAGLDIVDVSDPSNPSLMTNFDTGRSTQDVQVIGDLAYVVDRIDGLNILDISDSSSPVLLSITDTPGWAGGVTITDQDGRRYALMAHDRFDMQVLDVTNPMAPTIIGSITPLDGDRGIETVAMRGGLMYTAENDGGYRVWDFSTPSNPIELANINPTNHSDLARVNDIAFDGSFILLANNADGLGVYYNGDPLNPIEYLNYSASFGSGSAHGFYNRVAMREQMAFVAGFDGGLRIFDYRGCDEPCFVDFNLDGVLNFLDISIFLDGFNNDEALADINADGVIDFFDVLELINAFRNGCP